MSDWRRVPLGELYSFRSGLSKPRSAFGSGYRFLSFKDVFYNFFVPEQLTELVNSTERERESCSVHKGDVFLTRTSETMDELGMSCVALKDYPDATFNGFTKRLRPKEGVEIVPEYAGYYFRSPGFRCEITAMASLSTRASLNNGMLERLTMLAPSLNEQEQIGQTLKGFDDKIELNRRMNRTLEAIARAIFKSWFIDFDPVHAKAEGRDPAGMAPETAALFPDSFEDSPLGKVPTGWRVVSLGEELADLVSGSRPRGGAVEAGVPSIGAENVIGLGHYDFSKEKYVPSEFFDRLKVKGADVRSGDVLLYKDGARIGRKTYFDCGFPHSKCAVNEHVFILRLQRPEAHRYLFFWLDQDRMTQEIIGLNSNSAQPGINQTGVRGLPFLVPCVDVVAAFDKKVYHLTSRLFSNCNHSRTLAALRDALLPKLISGDLRVKDAGRFLKERGL